MPTPAPTFWDAPPEIAAPLPIETAPEAALPWPAEAPTPAANVPAGDATAKPVPMLVF
jgi:hypothetical protein